jgi:uncharacterized protein DUF1552
MPDWTPTAVGRAYRLPTILEPLAPFQDELLVLSGLAAHRADGPSGNHARAQAVFLTGQRPPDQGKELKLGVTIDQLAAQVLGRQTLLPSLELTCEAGAQSGSCDTPYSCAYTSNLTWTSATTPLPPEVNPRLVFDRLFGAGRPAERSQAQAARDQRRQSILDFVRVEAQQLQAQLGSEDRRKLDEYLTAVRALEVRLNHASRLETVPPAYPRPEGVPADHPEQVRLMCDLFVLAFQTDRTRVATLLFANEFSNRPYPFIGVRSGHHELSHHGGQADRIAAIKQINRFHTGQLAYLLGKLRAVREGDGTLLDHCLIAYGSAISDGNTHSHADLPILLAGRGGGSLRPGRHIRYPDDTPLMNLWLALLDRLGVAVPAVGDSTGPLTGLDG